MNINSASSVHKHVFNNIGKGNSNKNDNVEEKRLDSEIKALEQKKASLNKITDKSKIDDLDSQIKQKQAEKASIQGQGTNDSSISDENRVSNSVKTVKNSSDQTSNENDEKDNSELKSLDNFVTQTGVATKTRLKNTSKKHSDSAIKDDSNNFINNIKKQQHAENAIKSYKLIDDAGKAELKTNILA